MAVDATLQVSREVERFEVLDANHIKVWSTDGHEEVVQDLVLTCPIPNVLSILDKSAFQPAPQQLQALQRVEYSQRIAVALLFDESIAADVRALGWTSKYVTKDEDPIVRFLCWDNLKKHQAGDSFALLVHTGVPFGAQHMDNKDQNDEILATIVQCVHNLLAFLPEPKDTILHRWRYVTTS
jgi:predicted NAD/FAD-dependent oxidoreductase